MFIYVSSVYIAKNYELLKIQLKVNFHSMQKPIYTVHVQSEHALIIQEEKQ